MTSWNRYQQMWTKWKIVDSDYLTVLILLLWYSWSYHLTVFILPIRGTIRVTVDYFCYSSVLLPCGVPPHPILLSFYLLRVVSFGFKNRKIPSSAALLTWKTGQSVNTVKTDALIIGCDHTAKSTTPCLLTNNLKHSTRTFLVVFNQQLDFI